MRNISALLYSFRKCITRVKGLLSFSWRGTRRSHPRVQTQAEIVKRDGFCIHHVGKTENKMPPSPGDGSVGGLQGGAGSGAWYWGSGELHGLLLRPWPSAVGWPQGSWGPCLSTSFFFFPPPHFSSDVFLLFCCCLFARVIFVALFCMSCLSSQQLIAKCSIF